MKKTLLILLLIYPALTGFITDNHSSGRLEATSGFIDIKVESNINKLLFKYNLNAGSSLRGLVPYGIPDDTSRITITVPVKEFQCTNKFAYKDFLELLNETQFPLLTVSIPQKTINSRETGNVVLLHDVVLTIAGVSKKYDIKCRIEYYNSRDQILIGSAKIKLTDLDIEPPVKTLGLIRIKNEIIVNFGLNLNVNTALINKK